jgi:hypothetical protein
LGHTTVPWSTDTRAEGGILQRLKDRTPELAGEIDVTDEAVVEAQVEAVRRPHLGGDDWGILVIFLMAAALRSPGVEQVGVPSHWARERTNVNHAIPAYIDNLDDCLGLRVAADDEGTGDDTSWVSGLAEERPGQAGVVLGGEVHPDVDRLCHRPASPSSAS